MEGAWAKMLQPLSLTSSGRPQLVAGEVECLLLDHADFESGTLSPLKAGILILTTHRILWLDQLHLRGASLPLSSIAHISPPKKSLKTMFASPRIRLQLLIPQQPTISLVFRGQSNPDPFFAKLAELLHMKAWETAQHDNPQQPLHPTGANHPSSLGAASGPSRLKPAMAGVSGILRKEQEQWEETDKVLHDAFLDLNALMSKAKEMVILAEKMRARLLAAPGEQSSSVDDDELGSKQEMQDWLLSVGIASPVTKETAGALYHQQLSRQLADFVKVPLHKAGGMLALLDVYCLFNRARGTELISPEDLLQACTIWEKIDVSVMLRRFDSGVMVIQEKSQNDDEVFARVKSLVMKPETMRVGLSASDAARALGIAPALAKEHLLTAEKKGYLCRDDGPDGLRFFLNFFKDVEIGSFS